MGKKEIIILLSILLGITISGCTQQVGVVETTTNELAVETTHLLLNESESVEQAEGKSYKVDHEREESYEAREQEKVEKAMDITLKDAKKEEVVDSKIKLLEDKYNGKSYDEIMAIEGWKEELNDLHKQGYYLLNYEGYRRIVDKDTATKMIESVYEKDITGNGVGCITSEGNKFVEEVASKVAKKKAQIQAEDFSKLVKSHLKEGSGVASIENDMNTFGYTINNLGYVVPTEQAYNYMQGLKGDQRTLYVQTEMEAFKRNNYGKVTVRNSVAVEYSGSQGTFSKNGEILWVCREPNFKTTNALGGTMYAHCNYGYEEFREYCGGTTIAFTGWGEDKCDPNGQKNWCDAHNLLDKNLSQFVDCNYEWTGEDGQRSFRKLY